MFPSLMIPVLFALQNPAPPTTQNVDAPPAPVAVADQNLKPLSFDSQRFPYKWDTLLPVHIEVDGLKVNTIFFNRREANFWPLKGANFGVRAQLEVTNTSKQPKVPAFAVAVFDSEDRLLGAANGGTKLGTVAPGDTETFDLNFTQVNERLPLGSYFFLTLELSK
jgi:hypothetical protein